MTHRDDEHRGAKDQLPTCQNSYLMLPDVSSNNSAYKITTSTGFIRLLYILVHKTVQIKLFMSFVLNFIFNS